MYGIRSPRGARPRTRVRRHRWQMGGGGGSRRRRVAGILRSIFDFLHRRLIGHRKRDVIRYVMPSREHYVAGAAGAMELGEQDLMEISAQNIFYFRWPFDESA